MEDTTPHPPFSNPCVIHDPLLFRGGGEQYAAELASVLDAPLYTYRAEINLEQDIEIKEFETGRAFDRIIESSPISGLAYAVAYENFRVPPSHDLVVTTGAAAKSVIHEPHQRRYHLLHSPQRWLFDRGHRRYEDAVGPIRWIKQAYQSYMRVHDQSTIARIDDFVVNSEVIARRLQTYHRRDPVGIIYPPVNTKQYFHNEDGGYLLFVGRLEPHKGVGELVEAISGTDYMLKIAGTGSCIKSLRKRSGRNIELLGFVSESEKRELLANCDALLFNSDHEDFGIVPVEALASGKPVVGVNEGFTKHQIEDSVNGVLFDRGEVLEAVKRMYKHDWNPKTIQQTAARYDITEFRKRWNDLIQAKRTLQ